MAWVLNLGSRPTRTYILDYKLVMEHYQALPFTKQVKMSSRYDVEKLDSRSQADDAGTKPLISAFRDEEITREFTSGTDTWNAGDLEFRIYSPVRPVPHPKVQIVKS